MLWFKTNHIGKRKGPLEDVVCAKFVVIHSLEYRHWWSPKLSLWCRLASCWLSLFSDIDASTKWACCERQHFQMQFVLGHELIYLKTRLHFCFKIASGSTRWNKRWLETPCRSYGVTLMSFVLLGSLSPAKKDMNEVSDILHNFMTTSSNGNSFSVTGPLCGEFTGHRCLPSQRPATRSFDVFFHLRLNKRLSKQS